MTTAIRTLFLFALVVALIVLITLPAFAAAGGEGNGHCKAIGNGHLKAKGNGHLKAHACEGGGEEPPPTF